MVARGAAHDPSPNRIGTAGFSRHAIKKCDAFKAEVAAAGALRKGRMFAPSGKQNVRVRSDRRLVVARSGRASSQCVEIPK